MIKNRRNRYSENEVNYNVVLKSLSRCKENVCKQSFEFENQMISRTPPATFKYKEQNQQDQLRKERIKNKIKNKVREKIQQIFSQKSLSELIPRKLSSSIFERNHFLSVKSSVGMIQKFVYPTLKKPQLILKPCIIEQIMLHEKKIPLKNNIIRSKIFTSVKSTNKRQTYKKPYTRISLRQNAMPKKLKQNFQQDPEKLEPWDQEEFKTKQLLLINLSNRMN